MRLIEQQDASAADALTAARTRRADQQTADLALSAASSRELLLRDQLGAFERDLGAAQAELAQVKTQLEQAQAAPQPGLFERLLRSLLRRLRG